MKFARIAVLIIALAAGGLAAMMVGGSKAPSKPAAEAPAPTAEVLVALHDIQMGTAITAADIGWRAWPEQGSDLFITKAAQPGALDDVAGQIARLPITSGEPIRPQKIVKSDGSGFMAAILPAGMRAVATEISEETGVGGFILPNDRVDVLMTPKTENNEAPDTRTLLTNVRVLAIDQAAAEQDGQKAVVGRTATLELLPHQTEILAAGKEQGTISLALRSLADANPGGLLGGPEDGTSTGGSNRTSVVRFGITTN